MIKRMSILFLLATNYLYADESLTFVSYTKTGNAIYYDFELNKCYEAKERSYEVYLIPIKCPTKINKVVATEQGLEKEKK